MYYEASGTVYRRKGQFPFHKRFDVSSQREAQREFNIWLRNVNGIRADQTWNTDSSGNGNKGEVKAEKVRELQVLAETPIAEALITIRIQLTNERQEIDNKLTAIQRVEEMLKQERRENASQDRAGDGMS